MRLTNVHREAYIRSALNDVPKGHEEEILSLLQKAAEKALPESVRRLVAENRAGYLKLNYYTLRTPHFQISFQTALLPRAAESNGAISADFNPYGARNNSNVDSVLSMFLPTDRVEIEDLVTKHDEILQRRNVLKDSIRQLAFSATTTDALAKLAPEFSKYLPKEPEKAAQLPAVRGVVEAFKDAGWPTMPA